VATRRTAGTPISSRTARTSWTPALYTILQAGGFTTGGFNFDAKLRRQSVAPDDLLHAHVGGMDTVARARCAPPRCSNAARSRASSPSVTRPGTARWAAPSSPASAHSSISTKDKRIVGALYGIGVNPQDARSGDRFLTFPGYIVRVDPGSNPSETALAEIYEPPAPGYGPRGFDIDRTASHGYRSRAATWQASTEEVQGPLNGPTAATVACPEGWDTL